MTKLMTRKEAAAYLGISLPTLDKERNQGRLAFIQVKDNSKVWISEESIENYLKTITKKAQVVDMNITDNIKKIKHAEWW